LNDVIKIMSFGWAWKETTVAWLLCGRTEENHEILSQDYNLGLDG
jgi:hypothetical protein